RGAMGRSRRQVLPEAAQKIEASGLQQYSEALVRKLEEKSTELEHAYRELARSEAGLRQAQLIARLAHVITGSDGSLESWSDNLPGLIGIAAGDVPRTTREWLEI